MFLLFDQHKRKMRALSSQTHSVPSEELHRGELQNRESSNEKSCLKLLTASCLEQNRCRQNTNLYPALARFLQSQLKFYLSKS